MIDYFVNKNSYPHVIIKTRLTNSLQYIIVLGGFHPKVENQRQFLVWFSMSIVNENPISGSHQFKNLITRPIFTFEKGLVLKVISK
jgi:hypothetical protein